MDPLAQRNPSAQCGQEREREGARNIRCTGMRRKDSSEQSLLKTPVHTRAKSPGSELVVGGIVVFLFLVLVFFAGRDGRPFGRLDPVLRVGLDELDERFEAAVACQTKAASVSSPSKGVRSRR